MSYIEKISDNEYRVRTCAWSAPGCHPTGCGLILHVKDGKLVKVEGDPEHPISQGRLCIRCLTLPEYIYHPQRITRPLKRLGERGENKWQEISWDEAYDLIEKNIRRIQKEYGPEAIAMMGGTGREATNYFPSMCYGIFQSPNNTGVLSGLSCYGPRTAVTQYVLGTGYPEIDHAAWFPDRYDNPEFVLPKYVMIWGKSPLQSNADGFFGHAIIDMMKRGTKLIVVDPRCTWLANRSEYHLQLRPGSDTALAMGMLRLAIYEEIYDKEFVNKWCFGLEDLKERVKDYTPEKVEAITWVPKETFIAATRAFMTSKPSSISWGVATEMNRNGVQNIQSILYLLVLSGNLDIPGANQLPNPHNELWSLRYEMIKQVSPELYEKRIGIDDYPFFKYAMIVCHPDSTLDVMESKKPYPIKMLWFNSTNPIVNAGAVPKRWYKVFKEVEFCVCQDIFMTPTASAFADIFLPMSTFAEHDGVVMPHFGRNTPFIGAINKAIDPVGEAKSDLEISLDLGKRLNPEAWRWKDTHDFLTDQIKPELGIDFEKLQERVTFQRQYIYKKYEKGLLRQDGQPGFDTLTGLIELKITAFENWGEDPLPYFEEPPYSPYSTPELSEEYPLVLTTGGRQYTSFHSEHRQIASLREITPYPIVQIHPETAAKFGIEDGDWVAIENMLGRCIQKASVTPIVDPRVVHAVHGWWWPEQDIAEPNLGGAFKSNINMLMPHKQVGKLGVGAPYKNLICKIYKVNSLDG